MLIHNYRNIYHFIFFVKHFHGWLSRDSFNSPRRRVACSCACDPTVSIKLHASGTPLNWKSDRLT